MAIWSAFLANFMDFSYKFIMFVCLFLFIVIATCYPRSPDKNLEKLYKSIISIYDVLKVLKTQMVLLESFTQKSRY